MLFALLLAAPPAPPTYWADARPVLRKHCTVCHNDRKLDEPEVSAGLALNSPAVIAKGGKVPVLVPGKPGESLLVTLLTEKNLKRRMPLDAEPLSEAEIALLKRWVETGAVEGEKPAEVETVAVLPKRTLPVAFPTKATLARQPLELTLPVGPLPPVTAVVFEPKLKLLAVGFYGRVVLWDLEKVEPVRVITNVLAAVNDVRFSPDGTRLAVAGGQPSARGDLRIFDTATGKLIHTLPGHADVVGSVAFSPDGSKLASASFDKTTKLWDVAAGKLLHTYTGHSDFVHAVAFAPNGLWYATASKDRTARVIDAKTGQGKLTLSGPDLDVTAVAVTPDGKQIVTAGHEPALLWWDSATGERTRRQAGHNEPVNELAIDPKGTTLVSAGTDRTARIWNGKTGAAVRTLAAGGVVYAVAADGPRVAVGLADGTVKLFDPATGRHLLTLWADTPDRWLAAAPEGFVNGPPLGAWAAGGKPVPEPPGVRGPKAVGAAARGEKVPDVQLK